MRGKRDPTERIIQSLASWGLRIREDGRGGSGDLSRSASIACGVCADLLSSRFAGAVVDGGIRLGLAVKPEIRYSGDRRKDQLIAFFNSLDSGKKRVLLRKFTYDYLLRALRKRSQRRGDGDGDGSNFSHLSAIALSIGGKCNLDCPCCVMKRFQSPACAATGDIAYILRQAQDLGVAYVSVMGAGEPFLDPDYGKELLRCLGEFGGMDFFVYTNGTTVKEDLAAEAGRLDNLVVLVSVDGLRQSHDRRRGAGTFERAVGTLRLLRGHGVPCGFSAVVDFDNYRELTSPVFLETMAGAGALFGGYNQACTPGHSRGRVFARGSDQRDDYLDRLDEVRRTSPIYVADLLSLEESRYGCRAKKGTSCFIDAVSGKVAPCVMFPFASEDSTIYQPRSESRLAEILANQFFSRYRRERSRRHLCFKDVRAEIQAFSGNPLLAADDRREVEALLEVVK